MDFQTNAARLDSLHVHVHEISHRFFTRCSMQVHHDAAHAMRVGVLIDSINATSAD